jgi:hypothetical protein
MALPSFNQSQLELARMTEADKDHAVRMMRRFGGGFVSSLADTWYRADPQNKGRLEFAFAEIFASYMKFKV